MQVYVLVEQCDTVNYDLSLGLLGRLTLSSPNLPGHKGLK